MSRLSDISSPENSRRGIRRNICPTATYNFGPVAKEFSSGKGLAQTGSYSTPPPYVTQSTTTPGPPPILDTPQSITTPSPPLITDAAALNSVINALQAELDTTKSVNTSLAASIARLQAEITATISVNNHLAASVARLQAEQAVPAPTTTTPTPTATDAPDTATTSPTTTPLPRPHPDHPHTTNIPGRGAASPEVFQEIIKTNWHGRLGRTHMVDVDALPATALTELDCLLRRKLHAIYPRGAHGKKPLDLLDATFAGLAALGLRLEDRGAYADLPVIHDLSAMCKLPTVKRGRNSVAWYSTHEKYEDYWQGSMMETLVELARYRGLFDDEGYLKVD